MTVCSIRFGERLFHCVGDFDEIVAKVQNDEALTVFDTNLDGTVSTDQVIFFQTPDYVRTENGLNVPPGLEL